MKVWINATELYDVQYLVEVPDGLQGQELEEAIDLAYSNTSIKEAEEVVFIEGNRDQEWEPYELTHEEWSERYEKSIAELKKATGEKP